MSWLSEWVKYLLDEFKKTPTVNFGGDDKKITLLSPKKHTRRLTCYYITNLTDGDVPVRDVNGNIIANISKSSRSRLDMEGTGLLPDGRVINVASSGGYVHTVDSKLCYEVMSEASPYGKGIYDEPLVPFVSLAANLKQIKEHSLFKRKVIIPHLYKWEPAPEKFSTGEFTIHDTGGAMKAGSFENGLWRDGGQFDVFVRDWDTYKQIYNIWKDYAEVIIMPRDLTSVAGIQETLNLLLDSGLDIDGIIGPLTRGAITEFQKKTGLKETGEWDEKTKEVAEKSLNNWK